MSIGELAHRTGVSRRMLRHWEAVGLVVPAQVDAATGYRWYEASQAGRVRAIAALRGAGFGLEAIADLLASELSQTRLLSLLRAHEADLLTQVRQASARLAQVRQRLDSLEEGHETIMSTLHLGPIPALRLAALRTRVGDESEIGAAVDELSTALTHVLPDLDRSDHEVVLVYDGVGDQQAIWVGAGVHAEDGEAPKGLVLLTIDAADRAATIRYPAPPHSIGDAWIGLDAQLEQCGLRTCGVHRQVLVPGGAMVLQAPVRALA